MLVYSREITCDYGNLFAGKRKSKEKITQGLTVQECHQVINNFAATSNDAALIVRLIPVSGTFCKSHVDLSFSYTFVLVITKTQDQVRIHKLMGRIIGDLRIIEQHLARTQCSFFINSSTGLVMCIPGEDRNKIIIWVDLNHKETEMHSYDIYKIEQQEYYILIPDLQAGGAIQVEFGGKRDLLQLDNRFVLRNLKA